MSGHADRSARRTSAKRRLIAEIREVAGVTGLDFWSPEGAGRSTDSLQMVLRQFVNGRIIARYAMIDEY